MRWRIEGGRRANERCTDNTNMGCLHLPSSLPLQKQSSHIAQALYLCWLHGEGKEGEGHARLLGEGPEQHLCTAFLYGTERGDFLLLTLKPSSYFQCCRTGDEGLLIKTTHLKISGISTLAWNSAGDYKQRRAEINEHFCCLCIRISPDLMSHETKEVTWRYQSR